MPANDPRSYVTYLPLRVAGWLRRGMGAKWLEAHGTLGDVLADLARSAVKIKFVDRQLDAPDAQNATGSERSLERYDGETNAAYAARLQNAFALMADNGRPAGLQNELAGLGWPNTQIEEAIDFDPLSPAWARFWVFVSNSPPHGVTQAPDVGAGWHVGDGTLVGIGGASIERLRRLKRAIVVWKPAHMWNEGVIFIIAGNVVGLGWHVGDPGLEVRANTVRFNPAAIGG